jgi:ketosteroid isomerase-like protein
MHLSTASKLPILILLIGIAGCAGASRSGSSPDEAAVVEHLAEQGRRFSAAYMQGDLDTMIDLYTEDGVVFPGNSEYIRGREALRDYWALPEGQRVTLHEMTPVEVRVDGSMAYDFGNYEVSGVNGDTAWGPVYGKYLVVWQETEDGTWKMHLDMWNSRPAPEDRN